MLNVTHSRPASSSVTSGKAPLTHKPGSNSSTNLGGDQIRLDEKSRELMGTLLNEREERYKNDYLTLDGLAQMIRDRQNALGQNQRRGNSKAKQNAGLSSMVHADVHTQPNPKAFSGEVAFSGRVMQSKPAPITDETITNHLKNMHKMQKEIFDGFDGVVVQINSEHILALTAMPKAHEVLSDLEKRINIFMKRENTKANQAKASSHPQQRLAISIEQKRFNVQNSRVLANVEWSKLFVEASHARQQNLSEAEKETNAEIFNELQLRYKALSESPNPTVSEAFIICSKANVLDLQSAFERGSREYASLQMMMKNLTHDIGRALVASLKEKGVEPKGLINPLEGSESSFYYDAVNKVNQAEHKLHLARISTTHEDYREYLRAEQEMLALDFCVDSGEVEQMYRLLGDHALKIGKESGYNEILQSRISTSKEEETQYLANVLYDLFIEEKTSSDKTPVEKTKKKKKAKRKNPEQLERSKNNLQKIPFDQWSLNELHRVLGPDKNDEADPAATVGATSDFQVVRHARPLQNYPLVLLSHSQERLDERFSDQVYREEMPSDQTEQDKLKLEFARSIIQDPKTLRKWMISASHIANPGPPRQASCLERNGNKILIVHDPIDPNIPPSKHDRIKIYTAFWTDDGFIQRRTEAA